MAKVSGLPKTRYLVDDMGAFSSEGRVAQDEIESRIPITGSGSPEGEVEADAGATYYDLDASTGSIHYVKMVNDVTGNRANGWTLA